MSVYRFDASTPLVNKNSGCPRALSDDVPLVVFDGGFTGGTVNSMADPLETAPAYGDGTIVTPWTVQPPNTRRPLAASEMLAVRRAGTGVAAVGVTWT